jgi:hypothetical protein
MTPKVFISHASEDKDRFVLKFAEQLRQKGIDAWLDKWEMLPGDSLVDKIFEDGIKEAKTVIVVLSNISVNKPWVKEELNAAVVKKINNRCKLIPVVIDNCEIPEALKSTVWETITDLSAYEASLERIVASIFGVTNKPPIGSPPDYVKSFVSPIAGLNSLDSLILKLSFERALNLNDHILDPKNVFLKDNKWLVPEQELEGSLEILDRNGYIKIPGRIGGSHYQITTTGFDAYANACIPDYQNIIKTVAFAIVNKGLQSNIELQQELNNPLTLIDHILDILEINNYVSLSRSSGVLTRIYIVSPALKRSLSEA